ncbi:prolyl oligopeptidase family serine peptidase [candidate division KSB1 bacterium]
MKDSKKGLLFITIVILLLSVQVVFGQVNNKKVLTIEEYTIWRSVTSTAMSDDGEWMTYGYRKFETSDTMYVKEIDGEKEHVIEFATGPVFSDDSKWLAYNVSVGFKEAEKLRTDKKPVPRKAELMNLETGEKLSWDNAASFRFSKGSKYFVVKKSKSDEDAKHSGTDLILRYLEKDYEELLGSVGSFSFNKPGNILVWTVDAADKTGNGLYTIFLDTGVRLPLDNENLLYSQLTWNEEGTALAVLKGDKEKGFVERVNTILGFTDFDKMPPKRHEFKPADMFDFPKDRVISEKSGLSWSEDLNLLFFGIKEQDKEPEKKGPDAKPVADVDIWHWADDRIQAQQMVQASRDRNFTFQSAINIKDKRFVELTDDRMRRISLTRDGKWGIGQDNIDYISDWKESQTDYYRVNTKDGERKLIFKAQGRTMGLSPDSKHYLYWEDGQVWDYVIDKEKKVNLTKDAPVSFVNTDYDHPGEKPAHGVTGWTKDGKNVILTHKYDLWLQPLNGDPATCLTQGFGDKEEIRFRYVNLDREERFIDLTKPMLLTAYGEWTKKAGFYLLKDGNLEKLIYEDKNFGRLTKPKNADKFMLTIETYKDFPDYYISDTKFSFPKRMTDANPQQANYKWGYRILFDFENKDGVRLQGTLAIPEDYKEGQRLPMHVNYYEKNSQNLHRYQAPRRAGSPNFAGMVSDGYLVMQPDIHLRTGYTHSDMLECIEAAVQKCIDMGYTDPARVSLHGHSFSGQGSAYISTQSKMFAAIVYGAGATDLVADFNQLWKSSGTNQHRYDIYGQGRFGTNPYDDLELYMHESAVFNARTMDTPLMFMHGTEDGSVEWLQAVEFYNALRFNGKKVIFLSYPGAGHGLRKPENQLDFQKRTREFIDHYLKDKPAPDWMVKGVPFIKKKK